MELIIIGAGTAGCILAKRLQRESMVIFERGTDQQNNPIVYNVANGAKAAQPPYSESLPIQDVNGTEVSVAKLYGGASSHNYALCVHGSEKFYSTKWQILGVSYLEYQEMFKLIESYSGKSQDPASRGHFGELKVSQFPEKISIPTQILSFLSQASILEAPKSLNVLLNSGPLRAKDPFAQILASAFGVPVVEDYNTGIGDCACTIPQLFIDPVTGLRSSTDVTYLKGLKDKVIPNATVDRIWSNGVSWTNSNGQLQFTELAPNGKIILCAGAIYTPIILQRSLLHGIGQGLMEHYGFNLVIRLPPGVEDFSSGPLAFVNNRRWQIVTGGSTLTPPKYKSNVPGTYVTFLFWLLDPRSRGSVDFSGINMNFWGAEDMRELVEGAHYLYGIIGKLRQSYPSLELIYPPEDSFSQQDELEKYIKEGLSMTDHYSGTCKLGEFVDPSDFHLIGYPNLHVVDTSVFPELPDGNTEFPVAVMTEIAAMRIYSLRK